MSSKSIAIKSSDLRDSYAQKKYRDKSKSGNKDQQHVSHWFSLDIAAFLYEFVSPSIPVNTLKSICNDFTNFRMQNATTNLSNHKQIDNKLMKSFTDIMLPKFYENKRYKTLLKTNPCQLELEIRQNAVSCVILKHTEATRARAQTKRIQQLNFPNNYTAVTRLFYRCFKDSKHRYVWDDRRNTTDFKRYLKAQINMVDMDEKSNAFDAKVMEMKKESERYPNDDEKFNTKVMEMKKESEGYPNDDEKFNTKEHISIQNISEKKLGNQIKSANCDEMIGIDEKQRKYYKGSKGGTYYKATSGKKKYVSSDKIAKLVTMQNTRDKMQRKKIVNEICKPQVTEPKKSKDKIIGTDGKGRTLYVGSRGGKYYKTASGKKKYAK